jgi:hypothetical protein
MSKYKLVPWRPYASIGVVLITYSTLPFIWFIFTGSWMAALTCLGTIRCGLWCLETIGTVSDRAALKMEEKANG